MTKAKPPEVYAKSPDLSWEEAGRLRPRRLWLARQDADRVLTMVTGIEDPAVLADSTRCLAPRGAERGSLRWHLAALQTTNFDRRAAARLLRCQEISAQLFVTVPGWTITLVLASGIW
jgi:hypothetical protein